MEIKCASVEGDLINILLISECNQIRLEYKFPLFYIWLDKELLFKLIRNFIGDFLQLQEKFQKYNPSSPYIYLHNN